MTLRRLLLGVGALVVVVVAWFGWHLWQLNQDLSAAVDDANHLQAALRVGDPAAALSSSESLQEHVDAASDLTDGPTWSVIARLPYLGDDADGLKLVSHVLSDLSVDGIAPLAEEASDLNVVLPVDGRVPVERLAALQAPVRTAKDGFATAEERLSGQDSSGFVGPLRSKYDDLSGRVTEAAGLLDTADRALRVLPGMLGADGPRSYLLVFQNNAEIRALGGLPGAISVVNADDGRLTMATQTTAVAMGEADQPVLPLTESEQKIYGPQLGTYFLDANWTPSMARAADLMRARWQQRTGQDVDGVLMVDPVAVSYVLGVTGPVTVGPASLSSANVVDNMLHQIYVSVDRTDEQDELFKETARTVFDELVAGGANPQRMLAALGRGADEHRLLVHSFEPSEQAVIDGTEVAGGLTDPEADGPQVGIYLNDNTGAKMSYYLSTENEATATSCQEGVQTIEGTTTFSSDAPTDAATSLPAYVTGGGRYGIPPGAQLVAMRIYGPVGGSIDSVVIDGEEVEQFDVVDDAGRPVTTVYPYLEPQQTQAIAWTVTSGPRQAGDTTLRVTPGVAPVDSWATVASAC